MRVTQVTTLPCASLSALSHPDDPSARRGLWYVSLCGSVHVSRMTLCDWPCLFSCFCVCVCIYVCVQTRVRRSSAAALSALHAGCSVVSVSQVRVVVTFGMRGSLCTLSYLCKCVYVGHAAFVCLEDGEHRHPVSSNTRSVSTRPAAGVCVRVRERVCE